MGERSDKYPQPLSFHESKLALRRRLRLREQKVRAPKVRSQESVLLDKLKSEAFYPQKEPSALLLDMSKHLGDEMDFNAALNETAGVMKEVSNSARTIIYLVDEALEEIYQISHTKVDVKHRVSYKIGHGSIVAAFVAYQKQYVKLNDVLEDARFPDGLGNAEITAKSVLCVPVVTPDGDCLAVVEMSRDLDDKPYNEQDLRLAIVMCGWISSAIFQNQQRLTLQRQQELNDRLLNLTRCYFADAISLDNLITEIVNFAKVTLSAEHAIFYILKPIHGELYADFYEEGIGENKNIFYKKNMKTKLGSIDTDLISFVAQKGIKINIRNAYNDSRIVQDRRKGYITRSVLCVPIVDVNEILGVVEMINKKKGACFTKSDESLFETFSVYCAFVLSYARLYGKMLKTQNLKQVYLGLLSKHIQPCSHDYNFVFNHPDIVSFPQRFNQFDFYITDTHDRYMPQLLMHMFNEISKDVFLNLETMTRFILTVQNSYHNHPYHNFHHAFNVCHSIYNMLRRNMDIFTTIELKALVVAAFCHDVDHYGVTNNFLEVSNHSLAQLYEDSQLENHHYHVTMFIIKTLGIFSDLTTEEFKEMAKEIRCAILATDLAIYFKLRGKIYQICLENVFSWQNPKHRTLLKSVMMTAADLSGLSKPYTTAKVLTDCVYKEFYNEGDKEKAMGLCPLSIMDREKANMVPCDQVQFLTVVVLPCHLILTKLLPNCAALYKEAMYNVFLLFYECRIRLCSLLKKLRETWQQIHDSQGQKLWTLEDPL